MHIIRNIRQLVKDYTADGFVVIPVFGKKPVSIVLDESGQPLRQSDGALVRWQPYVERFPTEAELESFEWDRATGLALVIGDATWRAFPYIWCLDIEAPHRDAAEHWLDQHVPGWRDGVVVGTGSGGLHVYFLADRPVRTQVFEWGEVRGRGALCVLPPSVHPDTGQRYRWLAENWSALVSFDPAAVPGYQAPIEPCANGRVHEPVDVARALQGAPLGERNRTLFRLACKLRAAGIPAEWATTLVRTAAANCRPPWGSAPDEEPPEKLVQRVYDRYQPAPERISDRRQDAGRPAETEIPDRWRPVPADQLATIGLGSGLDWIWQHVAARGHLTVVAGLPKVGKTELLAAFLRLLASGGELAGQSVAPGKALVVSEEPVQVWKHRIDRYGLGSWTSLLIRPLARPDWPTWRQFLDHLTTLAAAEGYSVIVFDTLTALAPPVDENDARAVLDLMVPLQELAERTQTAVVLVHHLRKADGPGGTGVRGSGALAAAVDIIVELRRSGSLGDSQRVVSVLSRYNAFDVVIDRVADGVFETVGEPAAASERERERLVLEALGQGPRTVDELAEATGLARATVARLLDSLLQRGAVNRTGAGRRGEAYRWYATDTARSDGPGRGDEGGLDAQEKKPGTDRTPHPGHSDQSTSPTLADEVREEAPSRRQHHSDDAHDEEPAVSDENGERGQCMAAPTSSQSPPDHTTRRGDSSAFARLASAGSAVEALEDRTTLVRNGREEPQPGSTLSHDSSQHPSGAGYTDEDGDDAAPKPDPTPGLLDWAEALLAAVRSGQVQPPELEYKPGCRVVVPERFLSSHLAEAKLGVRVARENLRRYREALERAGQARQR